MYVSVHRQNVCEGTCLFTENAELFTGLWYALWPGDCFLGFVHQDIDFLLHDFSVLVMEYHLVGIGVKHHTVFRQYIGVGKRPNLPPEFTQGCGAAAFFV